MQLGQLSDFLQILPLPALVLDLKGDRVEILTPQAERLFDEVDAAEKKIPAWLGEGIHPLEPHAGTSRTTIARKGSRAYRVTLQRLPSPNDRLVLAVLLELPAAGGGEVLDAIPNPIFFKDLEGTYLGCNTAFCKALGREKEERKRAEERIQQLAFYDILTALPNRTLLRDRIGQTIRQCERSGDRFAIFLLGLDAFRSINDDFGHRAGDQLLRAVAGRLSAVVRKSDTLARVGGDEFVGVLPEVQDEEGAATVARKILGALEDPFLLGPHEVPASASIGIALFPSHGRDLDILLKHADAAMYRAKEMGGRRFQFFSGEMTDR